MDLKVEWLAFELDQKAPLEGSDLSEVYPLEYLNQSIDRLNTMGRELGLDYRNMTSKFNTRKAHLAAYFARDRGREDDFMEEVFRAYFTNSQNVADHGILREIARKVGLDPQEMMEALEDQGYRSRLQEDFKEARELKISSVPTFIVDGELRISGIQPYKEFKKYFF